MSSWTDILTARPFLVTSFLTLGLAWPCAAAAQASEPHVRLGVVAAYVASSELDSTEAGLGVLFAWNPTPLVGAEAEIVIHPEDMGSRPAFSSGRVETLFGVSVGPQLRRTRLFAKARIGIIRFWESPEPLACIAIFPAPVRCTLANGRTAVGVDIGAGVELLSGGRTFLRFDGGDRLLSFPGPVRDSAGTAHESGFFAHDLRLTVAAGVRF